MHLYKRKLFYSFISKKGNCITFNIFITNNYCISTKETFCQCFVTKKNCSRRILYQQGLKSIGSMGALLSGRTPFVRSHFKGKQYILYVRSLILIICTKILPERRQNIHAFSQEAKPLFRSCQTDNCSISESRSKKRNSISYQSKNVVIVFSVHLNKG